MADFLTDVKTLREKARQDIMSGPVTASYRGDAKQVVELLNTALATELVCVLRYRQHHFTAKGMGSEPVAAEFMTHSVEEQSHADMLAERIVQLGGTPEMDPSKIAGRAHSEYVPAEDLTEMIRENLIAERIAVASYTEMVTWIGDVDPTTRRVLEVILAKEEEHADDMLTLLER